MKRFIIKLFTIIFLIITTISPEVMAQQDNVKIDLKADIAPSGNQYTQDGFIKEKVRKPEKLKRMSKRAKAKKEKIKKKAEKDSVNQAKKAERAAEKDALKAEKQAEKDSVAATKEPKEPKASKEEKAERKRQKKAEKEARKAEKAKAKKKKKGGTDDDESETDIVTDFSDDEDFGNVGESMEYENQERTQFVKNDDGLIPTAIWSLSPRLYAHSPPYQPTGHIWLLPFSLHKAIWGLGNPLSAKST